MATSTEAANIVARLTDTPKAKRKYTKRAKPETATPVTEDRPNKAWDEAGKKWTPEIEKLLSEYKSADAGVDKLRSEVDAQVITLEMGVNVAKWTMYQKVNEMRLLFPERVARIKKAGKVVPAPGSWPDFSEKKLGERKASTLASDIKAVKYCDEFHPGWRDAIKTATYWPPKHLVSRLAAIEKESKRATLDALLFSGKEKEFVKGLPVANASKEVYEAGKVYTGKARTIVTALKKVFPELENALHDFAAYKWTAANAADKFRDLLAKASGKAGLRVLIITDAKSGARKPETKEE